MKKTCRQLVLLPVVRKTKTAFPLPLTPRIGTVALLQVDIKRTIGLHRGITLSYSIEFITEDTLVQDTCESCSLVTYEI